MRMGRGYLGEGPYKRFDPAYKMWGSMFNKCYCKVMRLEPCGTKADYHYISNNGMEVCEEWFNFQNFARWFYANRKPVNFSAKSRMKKQKGAKIYCPETCELVAVPFR